MTSSEMLTLVRFLVGDPSSTNQRWEDSEIYLALTSAQRSFVNRLLGHRGFEDHYDVLHEIVKSQSVSVGLGGYDISGLNPPMVAGGFVSGWTILDGSKRYLTKYPVSKRGLMHNRYFRGSDWSPRCYVEGNVFYVNAGPGSYPLTAALSYVSVPPAIDADTAASVNPAYHDLLCVMAEEHLRRSIDDFQQASWIESAIVVPEITSIASAGEKEPQSRTLGQYVRKAQAVQQAVLNNQEVA